MTTRTTDDSPAAEILLRDAPKEAVPAFTATADCLSWTVDLRVGQRVWARSGAGSGVAGLLASGGRPRLRGHVRPLLRRDWAPLGSGGVLPYDGGRIGEGEFRGETVMGFVLTVDAHRSALEQRLVPGA